LSQAPSVSIIMPVYNAGPYLAPAVASVFAQTLTDWELLAIDDASTDDSWAYLQRIDDPRVRVARNERNLGAPATLNRAIDLARGRWIARMDADDVILPARLELQARALDADPRIDLLGTGSILADRDLNPVALRRPPASHEQIVRRASMYFPLTFGALMGKTQWWRRWRVDTRIGVAGYEFDLYFRAHRDSVFANIPDPVYVYRFVGHTRSWTKMTKSVYYKSLTLLRHGFRLGLPGTTLLGLASMLPRPLLYAIKLAIGSQTGIVSAGTDLTEEDRRMLAEGLAQAQSVPVPLK
jgi:glycosyltransferase involved in cell wall biosynthesis